MSDSLQDQLLSLGLAKDKPKKQRKQSPRKAAQTPSKKAGGGRATGRREPPGEMSLEQAYALKKREEQQQADQARKKKQAEDRQRRLLNNQIREIVKAHRLNSKEGEVPRNFMFRGRIRKIYVTPGQFKALNGGEIGLAYLSGSYHLLANEHCEAIKKLSAEHVVDLSHEAEDDGEFPVPDDLSW